MKKTNLKKFAHSIVLILVLLLINRNLLFEKPINPDSFTTLSPEFTKIISFGNYRMISSFLWTKTLLDADIIHSKKGERSWLYYRFNLISDLDPTFYENYLHGGVYLSIIKDDIYSAEEIFSKGLNHYPNDFKLLYNAAFNYHFQIRNYNKSLELYRRIQNLPHQFNFKILPKLIKEAKNGIASDESHVEILLDKLRNTNDKKEREILIKKIENHKKKGRN